MTEQKHWHRMKAWIIGLTTIIISIILTMLMFAAIFYYYVPK